MNEKTLEAIRAHAAKAYPKECCGVVIVKRGKERYIECRNIATITTNHVEFIMHPADRIAAEEQGEIVCIVHSHCDGSANPTQPDLVGCEQSGKRWLIMSWPANVYVEIEPTGYKAPLLGRDFHHGIFDCYSLIRDYYDEKLGIELPDFEREEEWWLKGQNLYLDHFEDAGFVRVDQSSGFCLQKHDVILMQFGSPVPNHGGVYLGDSVIVQHLINRLSSRDVYGGWYRRITVGVVRHRSFM